MNPLTFKMIPFVQSAFVVRNQLQRVRLALIALFILISAFCGFAGIQQALLATPTMPPTPSRPPLHVSQPAAALPTAPSSLPSPSVATAPSCTPAVYSLPAPLNLTDQAVGLTQVIDATAYYRVNGNTSAQIRTQLQQCAPGSDAAFAAETGYTLTWHYNSSAADNGLCSISAVKVGLHINMILPQWSATDAAVSGLADAWQGLIGNLAVHENGHVAIDQQYAAQLLSDLQALPATDCASIAATVKTKADAVVADLNAANIAYDIRTNHGTTQGAVLP